LGGCRYADPRQQRLAIVLDDEHQRPDRRLPFQCVVYAVADARERAV
jgi:hypothetical protein